MRYLLIFVALLAAAAIATYLRYESLSPCVWLEKDMQAASGLPDLAVSTQIRAEFLLDGITEPDGWDCLLKWWDFKANGGPEQGN
jgi:hypothetical protein